MTNEQLKYHIAAIECDQAEIYKAMHDMRDQINELEFSDPDSCSQYFEEDITTIENMLYNKIYRALNKMADVLTAMKAEMEEEDEVSAD